LDVKNIISLISHKKAERLTTPANFRYGSAIHQRGGVEIIESSDDKVEAWVGGLPGTSTEGGGQRRRTQLFATDEGLKWHCAGNPKNHDIFCKHCVALTLTISQE
jgi:uncharacterized Zn finger protein